MTYVSRGLFDEGHAGEIDPGIQRIYAKDLVTGAPETLAGYLWVNRNPDTGAQENNTSYVLLFEPYLPPGNPNIYSTFPRTTHAQLRVMHDSTPMTRQQALAEYTKQHGQKQWRVVKSTGSTILKSWQGPSD